LKRTEHGGKAENAASQQIELLEKDDQVGYDQTLIFDAVSAPTVPMRDVDRRNVDAVMTRAMDVIIALLMLIFLAPLIVIVAAAVFVVDPGPVLFAHSRLGYGGKTFKCLKFRSMVLNAEERLLHLLMTDPAAQQEWERGHKLKVDPRVTRIGAFLRRTSLDELPQLFNVLRGEMSLVGPRPIVAAEIKRYGRYFPDYCSVRPGLTGLWQISGRSDTSYRRRVALDVTYCRSRSVGMDLRILFLTGTVVVLGIGSY